MATCRFPDLTSDPEPMATRIPALDCRALRGPSQAYCASLRICLADFGPDRDTGPAWSALTERRWLFPLLHNGSPQIVQVTQRKLKKTPCDSLFKHDPIRPSLTPCKYVLTCPNRTDLVIHDPHRPDGLAHLIRVRSVAQVI
jgi:hypothetical protein